MIKSRIYYIKPSLTEVEVEYATDAARNGWGDRCYGYIVIIEKIEEDAMQAQHIILEADQLGNIKNIPNPPNKKIEGIFFVLDDADALNSSPQMPHPDLAGQVQIFGNIFEGVPEQDWEILQ